MRNTLRKTMLGLGLGVVASVTAQAAVLYQEDFTTFNSPATSPSANGWLTDGEIVFSIGDQGTGTGNVLFDIGRYSHSFTSFSGSETSITVKSLIWTQVGTSFAGLSSTGIDNFATGPNPQSAQWFGFGPRMEFTAGQNFSLYRGGNENGGQSSSVSVVGATAGTANFSMVINVTNGTANAYFGSPESGTLLISNFDLLRTA